LQQAVLFKRFQNYKFEGPMRFSGAESRSWVAFRHHSKLTL
jgi:hypothetical protein